MPAPILKFKWSKPKGGERQVYHCNFDSWGDFLALAADRTGVPADRECESHGKSMGAGWYGTPNFETAVDLARTGWREGLERANYIAASIDRLIAHEVEGDDLIYSPVGYAPVVGAYLTGRPDSMIRIAEVEGARPVIKICANISTSSAISSNRIISLGGAVMALIMAFERAGFSTQVDFCESVTSRGPDSHKPAMSYLVPLKRAGENLEPDRLIFALAHPSTLRRLGLAVNEHFPQAEWFKFGMPAHYGMPCSNTYWLRDGYQIFLEGRHLDVINWSNTQKATLWIMDHLKSAGVKFTGELIK